MEGVFRFVIFNFFYWIQFSVHVMNVQFFSFSRFYLFIEDVLFVVLTDLPVPTGCMPSNKC